MKKFVIICLFSLLFVAVSGTMAAEEENVIEEIVPVNDTVEVPYGATEDEVANILEDETEFIGKIDGVEEEEAPAIELEGWIDIYDEYDPEDEKYPESYDADRRPNGFIFAAEALVPDGYEFDGDLSQVPTDDSVHVEDVDNATGATVSVAEADVEEVDTVEEEEELPETGGGILPVLPGIGALFAASGVYLLAKKRK